MRLLRRLVVVLSIALFSVVAFAAAPAQAGNGSDTLYGSSNETLYRDQSLFSPSRAYEARMQSDGNFVLYGPGGPLWASHTSGSSNSRLVMQSDGNLVIYDGGSALFASGSSGSGARLVLQNDGNLVIYASNGAAIWSTYTSGGVSKIKPTAAVAYARKQLGKPYSYGAAGPNSFDCSGLTQQSYASVGVGLNRTSQAQYTQGTSVGLGDLQPGDLVFYRGSGTSPGHVALYIGNGQIIEALKTGTNVMINPLNYPGAPLGARRVA